MDTKVVTNGAVMREQAMTWMQQEVDRSGWSYKVGPVFDYDVLVGNCVEALGLYPDTVGRRWLYEMAEAALGPDGMDEIGQCGLCHCILYGNEPYEQDGDGVPFCLECWAELEREMDDGDSDSGAKD